MAVSLNTILSVTGIEAQALGIVLPLHLGHGEGGREKVRDRSNTVIKYSHNRYTFDMNVIEIPVVIVFLEIEPCRVPRARTISFRCHYDSAIPNPYQTSCRSPYDPNPQRRDA